MLTCGVVGIIVLFLALFAKPPSRVSYPKGPIGTVLPQNQIRTPDKKLPIAISEKKTPPVPVTTDFIYLWEPNSADLLAQSDSSDASIFRFLLSHSEPVRHIVLPNETLDEIVRTNFFVYQRAFPNAYALYLEEIRRRNSSLENLCALSAGDILVLPEGPKFAAVDHPELSRETYQAEIEKILAGGRHLSPDRFKDLIWRQLGVYTKFKPNAEGSSSNCGPKKSAKVASRPQITSPVVPVTPFHASSLASALRRYSNLESQGSAESSIEDSIKELEARQIVPAADDKRLAGLFYLNREPVSISIPPPEQIPPMIAAKAYPAFVPASGGQDQDCKSCIKCRDYLGAPNLRSLGEVEVIVADTGISGLKASHFPTSQGAKYDDLAPNHHGTFVFSELVFSNGVSNTYGPLASQDVYVARVARLPKEHEDAPLGYIYEMKSVSIVMDAFSNEHTRLMDTAAPKSFPTWIANISASGKPQTASCCILYDKHDGILFVAAAGNDHTGDNEWMEKILFSQDHSASNDVFIVGALNSDGKTIAPYSNHHPDRVDLFAPGSCVCGLGVKTSKSSGQIYGTSQATPIVSAAAAYLAVRQPRWNAQQIKWRLISTSHWLDEFVDSAVGGVLDFQEALRQQFVVYLKGQDQPLLVDQIRLGGANDEWRKLLLAATVDNVRANVLRLHQQNCKRNEPTGSVCFIRYIMNRLPEKGDRMPSLQQDSQLTLNGDGKETTVKASEVEDIILTIDQSLQGNILAPPIRNSSVEIHTPPLERRSVSVEMHAPPLEQRSVSVEIDTPPLEQHSATVEIHGAEIQQVPARTLIVLPPPECFKAKHGNYQTNLCIWSKTNMDKEIWGRALNILSASIDDRAVPMAIKHGTVIKFLISNKGRVNPDSITIEPSTEDPAIDELLKIRLTSGEFPSLTLDNTGDLKAEISFENLL